ncbi:sulfate ABC transporter permease [Belliella kenyensis]|uniref:Sulfate ABC transporter permease n=1 Tax=Belliella kenyensis TaxID=1472724 RepID=A0ABV8EK15_9BACT|nr:sulfate ABC transporter permease [Belliella kenyensis]MCH7402984.1 sulfate ABC transporter permease [Belliella kenyensis]MDN3605020.1 sulfate ABC transporter permease [Belliella kenyensis]
MSKPDSQVAQRILDTINFDKRIFFIILCFLFITIRFVTNDIILDTIYAGRELSENGSLSFFHLFNALHYIWTPFSILWKVTLITFFLWTGAFALGYKINFKPLWTFVLVAETVFILPELIKMIIFISPSSDTSFQDIQNFSAFSLASLFDLDGISSKYHYPLKALNLFEVLYAFILTLGVHTYSKRNLKESFLIVLVGYVFVYLVWLMFYILVYK